MQWIRAIAPLLLGAVALAVAWGVIEYLLAIEVAVGWAFAGGAVVFFGVLALILWAIAKLSND